MDRHPPVCRGLEQGGGGEGREICTVLKCTYVSKPAMLGFSPKDLYHLRSCHGIRVRPNFSGDNFRGAGITIYKYVIGSIPMVGECVHGIGRRGSVVAGGHKAAELAGLFAGLRVCTPWERAAQGDLPRVTTRWGGGVW